MNETLDVTPSLGYIQIAIRQLSNGKAPGSDLIPVENYQEGESALTGKRLTLNLLIWVNEKLLQDFNDASIIHIYKRKENRLACDNHRKISLPSILGKIIARALLSYLNNHLEHGLLPESQWSFREWDSWHGVYRKTFAIEMSGKERWPLLDLCLSDRDI